MHVKPGTGVKIRHPILPQGRDPTSSMREAFSSPQELKLTATHPLLPATEPDSVTSEMGGSVRAWGREQSLACTAFALTMPEEQEFTTDNLKPKLLKQDYRCPRYRKSQAFKCHCKNIQNKLRG